MAEKEESFSEVEIKENEKLQNSECDKVPVKENLEDVASSKQIENTELTNDVDVNSECDKVPAKENLEDVASSKQIENTELTNDVDVNSECDKVPVKKNLEDVASSKQIENTELTNDVDVPMNIGTDCVMKSPEIQEGNKITEEPYANKPVHVDDSQDNLNNSEKSKCTEDSEELNLPRKQSDTESENSTHSTDEEAGGEELNASDLGASGCGNNNNDKVLDSQGAESKTQQLKGKKKNRPGIQRLYGGSGDNPSKKDKKKKKTNKDEVLESEEELRASKKEFHFFWQNRSVFSQWYRSKFYFDNFEYNCAEQFMMHQKALLMGDEESAGVIMALTEPREQKNVGRSVKNFDQKKWDDNCMDIVKKGNIAKFSQDDYLKKQLFSTYPRTLVEASPLDKIWGIGLAENDKRAWNRKTWRGENRLGQILTEVRDELMRDAKTFDS